MRLFAFLILLKAFSLSAQEADIFVDAGFEDEFINFEDDLPADQAFTSSSSGEKFSDNFSKRDIRRVEKSLSLFSGNEIIDRVFHLNLYPQGHFAAWRMNGHLGIPLRFPVYDNALKSSGYINRRRGFVEGTTFIKPRSQDFRTFFDAQKIVRDLEIFEPQEPYYFRLSRTSSYSLGNGDLMKDMTGEYLFDQDYIFANGHADFGVMRFDGVLGPLLKANILGLNAQFSPLMAVPTYSFFKDIKADIGYVADYALPLGIEKIGENYVLDKERRLLKRETGNAQSLSLALSSEAFPRPWLGLKPYLAYTHLFLNELEGDIADRDESEYGAGFSFGHQASIHFPTQTKSKIFFGSEFRVFSHGFAPNYFGHNYMLDRQSFIETNKEPISKAQYIAYDTNDSFRYGYMLELGYHFGSVFNSKISYEDARYINNNTSLAPLRKFIWINGLEFNEIVAIHFAYQASAINLMSELFDFERSRGLLSLRGQVKLLPYLYLDSWVKHSFGIKDSFQEAGINDAIWLASAGEGRSLNFGIGLEMAMHF